MEVTMIKKLFIDVGVGKPSSEAWDREKDFTIIGLEPGIHRYNNLKDSYPGKLLNMVASDKNGEIDCWENLENPENGICLFDHESIKANENFKIVKKDAIKLDSLEWRSFDEVHIWADIEGSELLMLKGATEILSSGKVKWINLEVSKNAPIGAEGWATAKQVYDFLDKHGFKPIVKFNRLRTKGHRDVIFVPKEE